MKVYKSKTGYFYLIFLTSLYFFFLGLAYYQGAPIEMYLVFTGCFVLILGYMVYLNKATKYIIQDNKLIVKCGYYKKELNIDQIKSVAKTSILLASPAPSFDRIEVNYGKYESLVISPKNKADFAKELTKINPKIRNKIEE